MSREILNAEDKIRQVIVGQKREIKNNRIRTRKCRPQETCGNSGY